MKKFDYIMKKITIEKLVIIFCFLIISCFCFSNPYEVEANPGIVMFTDDTILDLTGLSETVYIASSTDCGSLTVSATDLDATGIADGTSFLLKTTGHKVLQLTPSGGTADLNFSSNYFSSGYVYQWSETSLVSVAHIVGVALTNTYYVVKMDGVEITGSPFNSGASAEVSFTQTGSGVSQTFTIDALPEISSVSDNPDPVQAQNYNTFSVNWSNPDGDQIKIHICKTDAITGQTCDGGSWCDTAAWSGSSPTSCDYTTQTGDIGTKNYYAFVCDDDNTCSASTAGSFEVTANETPILSSASDAPDPIPVDSSILFRVYWSDPGDRTKIHICKTDAITGQTCDGGSWCDATSWSLDSPSSCTYLVQSGDLGTQNYYAFVCDYINNCSLSRGGSFNVTELQEENSLTLLSATSSGFLISSIMDTGVDGGASFHSLLWQGTLCSGCVVKFQLASSNKDEGPWNYYGPSSTVDFYTPNPGVAVMLPVNGDAAHQNKRYIRYKIYLEPFNSESPQVDDIVINWSP